MRILTKHIKVVLTSNKGINNRIVIIIALYSIYNNFDTKRSIFLKIDDKIINEI